MLSIKRDLLKQIMQTQERVFDLLSDKPTRESINICKHSLLSSFKAF